MRRQQILISLVLALMTLVSTSTGVSANLIINGDFDRSADEQILGWKVTGNTNTRRMSGRSWQRFHARFNSRNETQVLVVFDVRQGSTGTLWLDNFRPGAGLTMLNPSFEQSGTDGKPVGWSVSGQSAGLDVAIASDGARSLRITHKNEAAPTTIVFQKVVVEPNTEYSVDMDIAISDDFGGEARMLIYDPSYSFSMQHNLEELLASELVAARDRCGGTYVELLPAPHTPVKLSQQAKTKPNQNLSLSVDIQRKAFTGIVSIAASDAVSGAVLGSTTLDARNDQWETVTLPFVTESAKVLVSITAEGSGSISLDNIELAQPRVMPELQRARWLPSTANYILPKRLGIKIDGGSGGPVVGAIGLLTKDLAKLGVSLDVGSAEPGITVMIGDKYAVKGKGPESYRLDIDRKGIRIGAATQSGAFYAVMTLLQLLAVRKEQAYAVACNVVDYPDFPVRAMIYADPEQCARWKSNMLFYSCGYPDTPEDRAKLGEFISAAKKLNLEIVPHMLGQHGGYYVEGKNPNLAIGVWQKDEQLTLSKGSPTSLAHPWVIRTSLTDITLKSADGSTVYEIGRDYVVEDGDMFYNYEKANPKPFTVARTAESRIPDGGLVLASYDHVSHYRGPGFVPYCVEEPQVRDLMTAFCRNLARDFKLEYLNVVHCLEEFHPVAEMIGKDSRVIRAGKTPVEELVASANMVDKATRQGNAKCRAILYAGSVNDYSKQAAPHLSRNLLVNVWGYDAMFPNGPGKDAIEFWTRWGHQTMGLAWYNLRNVRGWAQIIGKARRKGYPCLGLVGSAWGDISYDISSGGLRETARVSWRVPRKGEKGWVEVPEMPERPK